MQKIVSLAPSITETLFAVGAGWKLVGVTTCCDHPKKAEKISKIGGFATPDVRKIKSLEPDLVLATDFHLQTGIVDRLEKAGVNITVVKARTVLDIPSAITFIGRLTGCTGKAAQIAVDLKRRIRAVRVKAGQRGSGSMQKVCYLCSMNPLRMAGAGCCADSFIGLAGGINVGRKLSGRKRISLRDVTELDPAVIVVGSGHGKADNLLSYVKKSRMLKATEALRCRRIFRIPDDILSRLGPRSVEGLERFALLLQLGRSD